MQLVINKHFYFCMSIFDPQGLYIHYQKSTKKGQIIQKKPQKRMSAIKKEEIPRSIMVLNTYGYTVTPPGGTPPSPPEPTILSTSKSVIVSTSYNPASSLFTSRFNSIWNFVKNDFTEILAIPLDKVTSAILQIQINSVDIVINSSGSDTITFASDSFTDATIVGSNSNLFYQGYSNNQTNKVFADNSGYSNTKINSTMPYIVAGHDTDRWEEIVINGQLTTDVNLFQIYRNTLNQFGQINLTVYVNAIVNYTL